jgi:hypothetical protein
MVLRYWGERQVYPEDFAALVDRGASGIRTDALAAEVIRRGWQACRSTPARVERRVGSRARRPRASRHRPRRGAPRPLSLRRDRGLDRRAGDRARPGAHPFRVLSRAEFERAWARPRAGPCCCCRPTAARPSARPRPLPRRGARLRRRTRAGPRAGDGAAGARRRRRRAEAGLLAAVRLCPRLPAAWRELAGVRFLQSRWAEASTLAERAALLDPGDEQGRDLLATSRFLNDEPDAALDEWNRIGRPSVDLVRVEGARRTRHPVVAALVDLPPRTLLTAERHGRAARRLHELPSAALTRVRYRPLDGGLAEVEAVVVERATLPRGVVPIAAAAGRTWLRARGPAGRRRADRERRAVDRRVAMVGGPSAARVRPGRAGALRAAGVATIEGVWERQSYATPGPTEDAGRGRDPP